MIAKQKVDWPAVLEEWGRLAGLPPCSREYRFAAIATGGTGAGVRARLQLAGLKDWRFDLAYPSILLAVEVDGGGFIPGGGRHSRGAGMREDCHKISTAVALGWRVMRVMPEQIKNRTAVSWLLAAAGKGKLARDTGAR